jgi:hypothetical protein
VGEERLVLALEHTADVEAVGGMKALALMSAHRLHVIEGKSPSAPEPRIVDKAPAGAMIRMRVDGPVRDDQVRFLRFEKLRHLGVARLIHDRGAVDFAEEHGLHSEDFTRAPGFFPANGCGFGCGLARYPGLARGQIDARDIVPGGSGQREQAARTRLGVVRMPADHEDPQFGRIRTLGTQAVATEKHENGKQLHELELGVHMPAL